MLYIEAGINQLVLIMDLTAIREFLSQEISTKFSNITVINDKNGGMHKVKKMEWVDAKQVRNLDNVPEVEFYSGNIYSLIVEGEIRFLEDKGGGVSTSKTLPFWYINLEIYWDAGKFKIADLGTISIG